LLRPVAGQGVEALLDAIGKLDSQHVGLLSQSHTSARPGLAVRPRSKQRLHLGRAVDPAQHVAEVLRSAAASGVRTGQAAHGR